MGQRRFTTLARGVLGYNLLVILWGAYVRASGSGAGCGSHWPLCNGAVVPRGTTLATVVEYTHRLTSGVALVLVAALCFAAFRTFGRRHPARLGAALSVVFLLTEAAVGAGLVLFELVARDESLARALFMGTHLANTFLLLAALTLTAYWGDGGAPVTLRGRGRPGLLALALAATVVLGVSGAVAALGDTLYPADSLRQALAQDLSPTSHLLVRLRTLHPLIAVVVSLLLLYLVSQLRGSRATPATARRFANLLNLAVVAQLAVGALNVALSAPLPMQLLHLLLADGLWIVLVLTAAASLAAPQTAPETAEAPALAPAGGES